MPACTHTPLSPTRLQSVNGKKTTPGSLYSKAFTSTGQSESSPTTAVSGATPVGGR
jgi:hypothetical protein